MITFCHKAFPIDNNLKILLIKSVYIYIYIYIYIYLYVTRANSSSFFAEIEDEYNCKLSFYTIAIRYDYGIIKLIQQMSILMSIIKTDILYLIR